MLRIIAQPRSSVENRYYVKLDHLLRGLRGFCYSSMDATSECATACMDSMTRFDTPTFLRSLATCAFTVRSVIPRGVAISLLVHPATSILSTSCSRIVNGRWPTETPCPENGDACSTNIARTRLGAQTDPASTVRIASTNSPTDAASSMHPFAPAVIAFRIAASSRLHPVAITSSSGRSIFIVVSISMMLLRGCPPSKTTSTS